MGFWLKGCGGAIEGNPWHESGKTLVSSTRVNDKARIENEYTAALQDAESKAVGGVITRVAKRKAEEFAEEHREESLAKVTRALLPTSLFPLPGCAGCPHHR